MLGFNMVAGQTAISLVVLSPSFFVLPWRVRCCLLGRLRQCDIKRRLMSDILLKWVCVLLSPAVLIICMGICCFRRVLQGWAVEILMRLLVWQIGLSLLAELDCSTSLGTSLCLLVLAGVG